MLLLIFHTWKKFCTIKYVACILHKFNTELYTSKYYTIDEANHTHINNPRLWPQIDNRINSYFGELPQKELHVPLCPYIDYLVLI